MRNRNYTYLLWGFVLVATVAAVIFSHRYRDIKDNYLERSIEEARHQLSYTEIEYTDIRDEIISLSALLQSNQSVIKYFEAKDQESENEVVALWSVMSYAKPWMEDATLLSYEGNEILKIHGYGEKVQVAQINNLDNLSQSDYFRYASRQLDGRPTIWGVELKEHAGEIIYPLEPVLRFIAPVTHESENFGYLVVNVDVWELIRRINYSPIEGVHPEILDEDGYFFTSLNKELLFGGILEERRQHNFSLMFPESWEYMSKVNSGHLIEQNHLIVFEHMKFTNGKPVISIIRINKEYLDVRAQGAIDNLMWQVVAFYITITLLLIPMAFMAYQANQRSIESKLARAALNGMSAVLIANTKGFIIRVNREFETITGYKNSQLLTKKAHHVLTPLSDPEELKKHLTQLKIEKIWQGEYQVTKSSGDTFDALVREQLIEEPNGDRFYIISLMDITSQKELEKKLRALSERDGLTNIWNRRKFDVELHKFTKLVKRYPDLQNYCLALIDIDHFKRLNDKFGHDEGDRYLQFVAKLLQEELRTTDFIARVGGEEFAVLMPHANLTEIKPVLERVRMVLAEKSDNDVTVSIGATDLTSDPEKSYKRADVALYQSKNSGRNKVTLVSSDEYQS
jgi:diguanylate cyclase (GGDEF)-like protein/PAS domain S-box-containing protein